ncbi:diguanylate cyclase, GGDEF domain-containing protein [Ditylenchus destructor]|nr:diguanylate cyclase, GGDEF domain-containing protein [Ditylenchus destructor]
MISMARRYSEPLMLLVMDLDGAKAINATHGELKGDQAIALFGPLPDEQKRLGDVVARIDGQRFAVLMARSDLVGPPALDRRLRDALLELAPRELGFTLGYSAGRAKLRNGDRNLEDLLHRAEAALYAAKRQGKGPAVRRARTRGRIEHRRDHGVRPSPAIRRRVRAHAMRQS